MLRAGFFPATLAPPRVPAVKSLVNRGARCVPAAFVAFKPRDVPKPQFPPWSFNLPSGPENS